MSPRSERRDAMKPKKLIPTDPVEEEWGGPRYEIRMIVAPNNPAATTEDVAYFLEDLEWSGGCRHPEDPMFSSLAIESGTRREVGALRGIQISLALLNMADAIWQTLNAKGARSSTPVTNRDRLLFISAADKALRASGMLDFLTGLHEGLTATENENGLDAMETALLIESVEEQLALFAMPKEDDNG